MIVTANLQSRAASLALQRAQDEPREEMNIRPIRDITKPRVLDPVFWYCVIFRDFLRLGDDALALALTQIAQAGAEDDIRGKAVSTDRWR